MKAHVRISEEEFRAGAPSEDTVNRAGKLFWTSGTLALENAIDPSLVDALHEAFMEGYGREPEEVIRPKCLNVGPKRYQHTINLEGPFLNPAVYRPPLVFPILSQLLGEDCILQSVGVVCALPGAESQKVHQDFIDLFPGFSGLNGIIPPYAITLVVPLVDLNEQTGTTAVWEGSHRVKPTFDESDPLKGASLPWPKRGDGYLMDFRLYHQGTPNLTDQSRPILYLVYCRPWFQDRVNFKKQIPLWIEQEAYDRIPEAHLSLFKHADPSRR